ncbi:MAG: JAB domain-containing protein [Bacteroidales bacterium]|jgi:DNA repair protein RadC|nr:JAB domain-containing protein [Bacteroidales bacterium]
MNKSIILIFIAILLSNGLVAQTVPDSLRAGKLDVKQLIVPGSAIVIGSALSGSHLEKEIKNSFHNGEEHKSDCALPIDDLMRFFPVPEIYIADMFGVKAMENCTLQTAVISSASDAVALASPLYGLDHEELWVMFLNQSNRPIAFEKVTSGGWSSTVIDVRQILRSALMHRATAMIMFHNHPSGDPRPGQADMEETAKVKSAGNALDIRLLDHIIIGDGCCYSFAEESVLTMKDTEKKTAGKR